MPQSLYLVDAYALIYRSYYAFINNPRITTTGINTSATFGFCNFLLEVLQQERPDYMAVVFDPDGPTFRHEMYQEYKAHRPKMPEDLRKSIPYIKNIIKGLGVPLIEIPGYEADDVIATLAIKGEKEGLNVYMITPDKDYAQVVSEHIFMYKPGRSGNKSEIWGISEVLDSFGIERVEQVIDILGLMGDSADNIPGCSGIGPKSASTLIYKYGSIEGVYEHINELKGKQKENLLTCQPTVFLSKQLVTICTTVPTEVKATELTKSGMDKPILESIFNELELFSLSKRLLETDSDRPKQLNSSQNIEVDYKDFSNNLQQAKKELEKAKEYAFFSIFPSGNIYNSLPSYICFSTSLHNAFYIKFPHEPKDAEKILQMLKPIFESSEKTLISDDTKQNLIWLKVMGINLKNHIFDIKIAHYVLHPDLSHELPRLALQYLNYQLMNKKNEQLQLSFSFEDDNDNEVNFAEEVDLLFQLKSKLDHELSDTGLSKLFYTIEMPLVPVLAGMEYEGVSIDKNELNSMSESLKQKLAILEKEIYDQAGLSFNISSPKQLGEILFEKLKLDSGNKKTKTGQHSTSEQVLNKLVNEHPIVKNILDYRGLKKLLTTYTEALPTYIESSTGKIHTRFNQIETATGRLSSLNPNLQNIPIRTEDGRQIRKAFITGDDDYLFFSADYSQVELRIMAHLSQTPELIEAFNNNQDIHTATAAKIYHIPVEEVTSDMRRKAKTANFGIIYGISAWGLAERLQISRKEGKELIDGYFELYPGVKKYMDDAIDKARKKEYVETIMGRRRYLRDINSRNAVIRGMAERNAINAPLQGSAADIIKMAMICIAKKIADKNLKSKMILQVHDELIFKCHGSEKDKLTDIVISCMENIVSLSVPLTVSYGFGKNWYEAH